MVIIKQLLSKLSLTGLLIFLAGLFGYRVNQNRQQLKQTKGQVREYQNIIKDVDEARRIADVVDDMPSSAVDRKLHDNDWYRD